jgi:tetratricopeptide (TPR) repeat protein
MNTDQILEESKKYIQNFKAEKKDFHVLLNSLRANLNKNPLADFFRVFILIQNNLFLTSAKEICLIENSTYKEMNTEFIGDWFINKLTEISQVANNESIEFCLTALLNSDMNEVLDNQKVAYLHFLIGKYYQANSPQKALSSFESAIALDANNMFYKQFYETFKSKLL